MDIPEHRKAVLRNLCKTFGFAAEVAAIDARNASGEPWDDGFVKPINDKLDAKLAETDDKE